MFNCYHISQLILKCTLHRADSFFVLVSHISREDNKNTFAAKTKKNEIKKSTKNDDCLSHSIFNLASALLALNLNTQ